MTNKGNTHSLFLYHLMPDAIHAKVEESAFSLFSYCLSASDSFVHFLLTNKLEKYYER